jgi:hypothetical protein
MKHLFEILHMTHKTHTHINQNCAQHLILTIKLLVTPHPIENNIKTKHNLLDDKLIKTRQHHHHKNRAPHQETKTKHNTLDLTPIKNKHILALPLKHLNENNHVNKKITIHIATNPTAELERQQLRDQMLNTINERSHKHGTIEERANSAQDHRVEENEHMVDLIDNTRLLPARELHRPEHLDLDEQTLDELDLLETIARRGELDDEQVHVALMGKHALAEDLRGVRHSDEPHTRLAPGSIDLVGRGRNEHTLEGALLRTLGLNTLDDRDEGEEEPEDARGLREPAHLRVVAEALALGRKDRVEIVPAASIGPLARPLRRKAHALDAAVEGVCYR